MQPIGLFDSGLGGLTVLQELIRRFPAESFIYLGDTARAPYGTKGVQTIQQYSYECAQFLLAKEIKLLIVACNTASAAALVALEKICPCPVIGTIKPAVSALLSLRKVERIGVIGTQATIVSGAYQRALQEKLPEAHIFTQACPLFVSLVENGLFEGEIVDRVIDLYCANLRAAKLDALVLGCTHYPILKKSLSRYFGDTVTFIDSAQAIGEHVAVSNVPLVTTGRGNVSLFVTDDSSRFSVLSETLLEEAFREVTTVQLGDFLL